MNNIGDTKEDERRIMNSTRNFMSPEWMERGSKRSLRLVSLIISFFIVPKFYLRIDAMWHHGSIRNKNSYDHEGNKNHGISKLPHSSI